MWIDYKQAIAESAEQLLTVERRQRTSAVADRVKILRLLKTHPLLLPPYSPELNPAERWFEELRAALANTVFESTDMLMAALTRALEPYWTEPARLVQLTGYPGWLEGIANIRTPT